MCHTIQYVIVSFLSSLCSIERLNGRGSMCVYCYQHKKGYTNFLLIVRITYLSHKRSIKKFKLQKLRFELNRVTAS